MFDLKLSYFDFDGGRGEPIRLALYIGGIEFDDFRFPFEQFAEIRQKTPLSQVPVLSVNGKQMTQTNAILRFVGKQTGLYPEDNLSALLCDEILEAMEDITHKLVATFGLQGEELETARRALVSGALTQYLKWTQLKLQEQGGEYFVDNRLTLADLKVFVWVRSLNAGHLEHIPATLIADVAPLLNLHASRIEKIPAIKDYYSARSVD